MLNGGFLLGTMNQVEVVVEKGELESIIVDEKDEE